uniref:uncharacterized protein LOC117254702 n=1 Tax=Epinephelus lanceolatus TaxID=310571 RepID=UPI00144789E1|nr:uncharacterized protein LOC117254702 [Epinephelus lanceolatus]
MFTTASPDSFMPVTCSRCDPALTCEENGVPVVDQPILVFSGISSCLVLGWIVLYATVGVVAILTIVMLAVIVWKRSVKSKPQPQVCSNSIGADEEELEKACENEEGALTLTLISVKIKAVTGVEGQRFDFRCDYEKSWQKNAKYFCYDSDDSDDNMSFTQLIRTEKHDQWQRTGRFSLYDNTTAAFFIVRVDKLTSEDSGTYRCGVDISLRPDDIRFIQLNVSRANPLENFTHQITGSPIFPKETVDKLHLPLFMTAVMCMAAMLFICLFTLCLLLAIKQRRPGPRQSREMSSDYETMMPGVRTEPELRCSCSSVDCADLSALPPPPADLWSHFPPKNRESTVTLGLGEYVDVDVPKQICQYQHLDLSQFEEHVYHSLHGNNDPKDGPVGVKELIDY